MQQLTSLLLVLIIALSLQAPAETRAAEERKDHASAIRKWSQRGGSKATLRAEVLKAEARKDYKEALAQLKNIFDDQIGSMRNAQDNGGIEGSPPYASMVMPDLIEPQERIFETEYRSACQEEDLDQAETHWKQFANDADIKKRVEKELGIGFLQDLVDLMKISRRVCSGYQDADALASNQDQGQEAAMELIKSILIDFYSEGQMLIDSFEARKAHWGFNVKYGAPPITKNHKDIIYSKIPKIQQKLSDCHQKLFGNKITKEDAIASSGDVGALVYMQLEMEKNLPLMAPTSMNMLNAAPTNEAAAKLMFLDKIKEKDLQLDTNKNWCDRLKKLAQE